jgi:hypothetical protein
VVQDLPVQEYGLKIVVEISVWSEERRSEGMEKEKSFS